MESLGLPLGVQPVTQRRVVRSEWTKLISLRSTRWALAATVLLAIGIGLLACTVFETRWAHLSAHDRADFHPLSVSLAGINFAQLAIGVLGVLVITGEYSTGMIRSTLAAVPGGCRCSGGRPLVFGATAFAISLPATFIVFFAGQAILSGEAHQHCARPSGRVPGAVRRAPLPHRDGALRPRPRRDPSQHRGGSRPSPGSSSSCRRSSASCRPASPTRSIPTCRATPGGDLDDHPGPGHARALGGFRHLLRLRRHRHRDRRGAARRRDA